MTLRRLAQMFDNVVANRYIMCTNLICAPNAPYPEIEAKYMKWVDHFINLEEFPDFANIPHLRPMRNGRVQTFYE